MLVKDQVRREGKPGVEDGLLWRWRGERGGAVLWEARMMVDRYVI
jgi:hypothetical protein